MGLASLMSIPMIFWESALAPKPGCAEAQTPELKDTVKTSNPIAGGGADIIDENNPEMGKSNKDRSPKHRAGKMNADDNVQNL